jgi:small GTP-binding protein
MGSAFSYVWEAWFGKTQKRIALVGLDGAGKTTLLYALKLDEALAQIMPTVGFNIETVETESVSFTVVDIGGHSRVRRLWRHYMQDTHGVIFVVDSADTTRLVPDPRIRDKEKESTARDELWGLLGEACLADVPLLVYANKQDLDGALKCREVIGCLALDAVKDRRWRVEETIARTGAGVREGLDWLAKAIVAKTPLHP